MSKIEWTDVTWNPVTGCEYESPGCKNCYAATMTRRLEAMGQAKYRGLVGKAHFNGKVLMHPSILRDPLRWRKPRKIFVCSMSDLFHPDVEENFIDRVFATIYECQWHTFQILTKRPQRMLEYFLDKRRLHRIATQVYKTIERSEPNKAEIIDPRDVLLDICHSWPLPNVWLGTSVENQEMADKRIPPLLECPAAVRFLSCEPLLEEVDLLRVDAVGFGGNAGHKVDCIRKGCWDPKWGFINHTDMHERFGPLHWVIAGLESGPNSRRSRIEPVRSLVQQCQAAEVPIFVKQLGAKPAMSYYEDSPFREWALDHGRVMQPSSGGFVEWDHASFGQPHPEAEIWFRFQDPKGGDPSEWPEDLRVQEWPAVAV